MTRGAWWLFTLVVLAGCAESKRTPNASPPPSENLPGAATLVGTCFMVADTVFFTHCAHRVRYPVARVGDFGALERAVASESPVLVSVIGRLQPLPEAEGSLPRDQLIVDRLLRAWPDESCEKLNLQTPLVNTYWKLVELNGQAVAAHGGQREVHLMLGAEGNRVGGFGGCGSLSGRVERDGTRLRFVDMGSTLAACPYSDDERAFLDALAKVTSYQILGESLDLRDPAGPVARFRAVYLK